MLSWKLVWTGQPCWAGNWSELVNQLNHVELETGLNWSTMLSWKLVWTGQPAKPCWAGNWSELTQLQHLLFQDLAWAVFLRSESFCCVPTLCQAVLPISLWAWQNILKYFATATRSKWWHNEVVNCFHWQLELAICSVQISQIKAWMIFSHWFFSLGNTCVYVCQCFLQKLF